MSESVKFQQDVVEGEKYSCSSFYCHKIPLYQWNHANALVPGQYTFPFSFQLTQGTSGAFEERGNHDGGDYYAVIKYKVKAEVKTLQGEKIKNKQELTIREQVIMYFLRNKKKLSMQFKMNFYSKIQLVYIENNLKPETWCCISGGESKIKCFFEKTTYVLGETARFIAELDNSKCRLNMEDMTSVFSRVLKMKSNDGKIFRMESKLKRNALPGVKSGKQERREEEIPMGYNIKQSTNGSLIDCEYFLTVTANLDGCICFSYQPKVKTPIQIVSLPPANYGFVQPHNWNPHVFEHKQLFLINQYIYQSNKAKGQQQYLQQQYYPHQMKFGLMPQWQQYLQQQPQLGAVQTNQLLFGYQQPLQGQYQKQQQQQQTQFGSQQLQQGQELQQNIQLQHMQGQNQSYGQQYSQTGLQQPQPGQQQPLSMGIQFQQTSQQLQGGQPQNTNQFIHNGVMPPPNMH